MADWRDAKIHVRLTPHAAPGRLRRVRGVRAYKTEQGTAIFRLQNTPALFNSARSCA